MKKTKRKQQVKQEQVKQEQVEQEQVEQEQVEQEQLSNLFSRVLAACERERAADAEKRLLLEELGSRTAVRTFTRSGVTYVIAQRGDAWHMRILGGTQV